MYAGAPTTTTLESFPRKVSSSIEDLNKWAGKPQVILWGRKGDLAPDITSVVRLVCNALTNYGFVVAPDLVLHWLIKHNAQQVVKHYVRRLTFNSRKACKLQNLIKRDMGLVETGE